MSINDSSRASDSILNRLRQVRARIERAAGLCGRDPESIRLLAVSKTKTSADIRAAIEAGQLAFGENYVQEALDKMRQLPVPGIEWHFIGRIQGNKTRAIAEHFDWVHSLADVAHARRLNEQRPRERPPLQVCLQVNVSGETSKEGGDLPGVRELMTAMARLPRLQLRGLMAIPAPTPDPIAQRRAFALVREWRDRLATPECPLETLSMGMSDDLEAAIAEGATLVRIGSAIFGPRDQPYSHPS